MKTISKLCAGLAVAFALAAGEASAVTLVTNVFTPLQAGGGAYGGQFDITSYLDGGAYRAVNARVTATGFSNPTVSYSLTPPSVPQLVDQQPRIITPGHMELVNCQPFLGCQQVWVPEVVVYDRTYQTFQDDRSLDLVIDRLRLDVGEAVAQDAVDQQFSEDPYVLGFTDTFGSQANGYSYYQRHFRDVTNIWAGPVSAQAVLTLNDLAGLNTSGLLGFTLDAPVGTVFAQQVRLDFDLTSAVPEPATWAMMLTGFLFMGGALRARRRQGLAS